MVQKLINKWLLSIAIGTIAFGCSTYDDTEIKGQIKDLEGRVSELETTVKQINSNIDSYLQTVRALENGDRILSGPTSLADGSGYEIVFSNSGKITIYNGKDGTPGVTPTINVKKDTDGVYYWTVNGEWLLDDTGGKVAATAFISNPQVRISDDNKHYEISFDGGKQWITIGDVVDEGTPQVAPIFSDVKEIGDFVVFTLAADGSTIEIPKVQVFSLNITSSTIVIGPGETSYVEYSVKGADEETVVDGFGTKDFQVRIQSESYSNGVIAITAPYPLTDGKVFIIAVNGNGATSAKILSFEEGVLTIDESAFATKVPASGGSFVVPFQTNLAEEPMVMVDPAYGWIHYVETKSIHSGTIVFSIDENVNEETRTGDIFVNLQRYTIVQEGKTTEPITSGGRADFETLNGGVASSTYGNYSTEKGWSLVNGMVRNTVGEVTPKWTEENTLSAVLGGRTNKVGVLTSPDISGGIGTLAFEWGSESTSTTISFKLEIRDSAGTILKEDTITKTEVEQYSKFNYSLDCNITGNCSIVFTNLCPSNKKLGSTDIVSIFNLEWTGYDD